MYVSQIATGVLFLCTNLSPQISMKIVPSQLTLDTNNSSDFLKQHILGPWVSGEFWEREVSFIPQTCIGAPHVPGTVVNPRGSARGLSRGACRRMQAPCEKASTIEALPLPSAWFHEALPSGPCQAAPTGLTFLLGGTLTSCKGSTQHLPSPWKALASPPPLNQANSYLSLRPHINPLPFGETFSGSLPLLHPLIKSCSLLTDLENDLWLLGGRDS